MSSLFPFPSKLASVAVAFSLIAFHFRGPNSCSVHGFAPPSSSALSSRTSPRATVPALRPVASIRAFGGPGDDGVERWDGDAVRPNPPDGTSGPAAAAAAALSLFLLAAAPPPASAADYFSFTPEQRFVAEAWRQVDDAYIDRTFNGQDWFGMRQDALRKKYKSMDEARAEVDGMLGRLGDRYTRYLPPAKYDSLVNAATGNVCGVGVELAPERGGGNRVVASDVEPNGPASRGGLMPNDVFVEVDGVRFDDGKATPDDVALVVRGLEGSKVGVVVEREGKTVDFILTREPIKITAVRSYVGKMPGVDGKLGVVRIKNFSGTTAATVRSELDDLKKKGATKFVLDLRGNPGGLLPGGVDTASLFLEADKPVVFVVNKKGVVDAQSTLKDGPDLSSPLVLLVDGNTASAAEVFTAALQENGRAVVVGERTFGKGIVQTVRQLENGNGGVAVTVARYETPEHHDINKRGISVDVAAGVDCGKEDALACLSREALSKL